MKYSESDIMTSDQKTVDYNCGENNLYREGKDFDEKATTDVLIENAPNTGNKTPLDSAILSSDKQSV